MRTSSMLTRQISFGARRLWRAQANPYAAQNLARAGTTDPHLRAPINDRPDCRSCTSGWARRLWRAQTNPYVAQNLVRATMTAPLKPQASSRPQRPLYRTIDGLGRMLRMAWQMHINSGPATNKIALTPVGTGRYDADARPPRPRLTFCPGRADTASDWQRDARPWRYAERRPR